MKIASSIGIVLALALISALSITHAAYSKGRPSCLLSNERTGLGSRSLQEAIDAAAPDDTLIVKGVCFGDSTIDKNLTLNGVSNPAFGVATLDGGGLGGGTSSVLNVVPPLAGTTVVAINDLTITHGGGAGICSCGSTFTGATTVELTGSTVSDNSGTGITGVPGFAGGGLTAVDSTISGNAVGIGGRVVSTLVRSTVRDNGFGISASRTSTSLTDSAVTGNEHGGMSIFMTTASVIGSTVSNNDGLGIEVFEARLSLVDSSVSGNSGGGLQAGVNGFGSIVNSNVTGNTTELDGGGIYVNAGSFSVIDSTVSGNTAGGKGGGSYVSGHLTLTDSTVSGNTATSGGGIFSIGTTTLSGANTFSSNVPEDCVGVSGC